MILLFVAYDFEAFVGNTGGYIGLFLGYALLQIPGIVFHMIAWFYNYFFKRDKASVRDENIVQTTNENTSPFQLLPGVTKHSIPNQGIVDNIKYVTILKTLIRKEVQNQLKNNSQEVNYNV